MARGSLTSLADRSIGHTACKRDSGWLDWVAQEEAKKRDRPQAHVRRRRRIRGAGLLRDPFTPAAVMTGQRWPDFPFGG